MELNPEHILVRDSARKIVTVATGGDNVAAVPAGNPIGVNEIEPCALLQADKEGVRGSHKYLVPTHVRDFQIPIGRVEPHSLATDKAKASLSAFLARRREQLHPQANSEQGLTGSSMSSDLVEELQSSHMVYGPIERAYPWKDHLVRSPELAHVVRDLGTMTDAP